MYSGRRLKNARLRKGLTQAQLGSLCGWTTSYVNQLEHKSTFHLNELAAQSLNDALEIDY